MPSEAQGKESSIKIGQTYFLDCIGEKGELGTVTTATVLESEKKVYVTVATEDGVNHIIAEPIFGFCQSWVEDCRSQTQNKPPL